MLNLKSLLHRALLALVFVAGAAVAGPTYHVNIDTNAYSGTNGFLYLAFGAIGAAPSADATLMGLPGASGPVTLNSLAGDTWPSSLLSFGGMYGFDVTFGGDYETGFGSDSSLLSVFLLNEDMTALLGNPDGSVIDFAVYSNSDESPANVAFAINGGDVTVTEVTAAVPEASQWAIFITGLGLMTWTMRRRQQR